MEKQIQNKNRIKFIQFYSEFKNAKLLTYIGVVSLLLGIFSIGFITEKIKYQNLDTVKSINIYSRTSEERDMNKIYSLFYGKKTFDTFDAKKQIKIATKSIPNILTFDMNVSGKHIASFKNYADGVSLLDRIKVLPKGDYSKLEYNFKEIVSLDANLVPLVSFKGYDEVENTFNYIKTGQKETVIYNVEKGDFLGKIALKFDITKKDIIALNPQLLEKKYLQIGEKLKVMKSNPMVNTIVSYEETYNEKINPEIVYEDSKKIYEGNQKIYKEGKDGEKTVIASVKLENGIEISREIKSTEILKEAQDKVILVGTKPSPIALASTVQSRSSSGRKLPSQLSILSPVNGYIITSYYGMRSGGFHRGIDLAVPVGTNIYASELGTVIESSYNSGYGKYVHIRHSSGVSTLYAHCSELLVSVGDKVEKGDVIAKSGNTGRSTGPHLHFEIQINRQTVNPINYYSF